MENPTEDDVETEWDRKESENARDTWQDILQRANADVQAARPEQQGGLAIEWGERILAVARQLAGVACRKCGGCGRRVYSSTATWKGGIGGQAMTEDVCDECWGTGQVNRMGVDLRRLRSLNDERGSRSYGKPT